MSLHVAKDLLDVATTMLPPPEGRYHSLMLREDGEPGLAIVLQLGEKWKTMHLDEEDMNRPPAEVMKEIVEIISQETSPSS